MTCIRTGPRERGYVLITVILLLSLVGVIAFLNNQGAVMNTEEVARAGASDRALLLAEAGLAHASLRVQTGSCTGSASVPAQTLGEGTYAASAASALTSSVYVAPVDQDTWLDENAPDTAFGGDAELHVMLETGRERRAMYRYDLSGIASGARVISATAWFFVTNKDHKDVIHIHEVDRAWVGGTATWNTSATGIVETPVTSIPTQEANNVWVGVNLTALVQSWVNGSVPNHGLMLMATSESTESRYTSSEWGTVSQRPWLEVVVGSTTTTTIRATGTLPDGTSKTLTRTAQPLYQAPATSVFRPDAAHGDDTWISATNSTWNYGGATVLNTIAGTGRVLVRFDLGALPTDVRIESARLGLYLVHPGSGGAVEVHRLSQAWREGSCPGSASCAADGATWNTYNGSAAWASAGGDYDSQPEDSRASLTTPGWMEWDVTNLVDDWVSGQVPNNGMLLKAPADTLGFASSDATETARHPRLAITFRCRCGDTCQVPHGWGNLLMIVRDAAALTATETVIRDQMHAWGYAVTPLAYDATSSEFGAAVTANDVIYVPAETPTDIVDSLLGLDVGDRARSAAKGVVTAEGRFNDDIGIAAATATPIGATINVTDTSHYITLPFAPGSLAIKTADTRLATVSGTTATGLQTLADSGGVCALGVLETGAALYGGGTAAARRVVLPLGSKQTSNWAQLGNNGRLLVQRALQWASGDTSGGDTETPMKIYWTDDQANKIQRADADGSNVEDVLTGLSLPTGLDIDTLNGKLYWTNNLSVMRANVDGSGIETLYSGSAKTFDVKLDVEGGKMYWTHDSGSSLVMRANLDGSSPQTISTVANRPSYLSVDHSAGHIYLTEFGSGRISRTNLDGSGYTTLVTGQGTPIGNALAAEDGKIYWTDGAAGDSLKRASLDGSGRETVVNGLHAPQDVAIDSVNQKVYWVDALTIPSVKRADLDGGNVETLVTGLNRPRGIVVVSEADLNAGGGGGSGGGGSSGCDGNFRDEFNNQNFSGNDGTRTWNGDWQEINESDGPTAGDIRVFADLYENPPMPTYQVHVRDNDGGGEGLMRALDLTGAGSAVLSFDYKPAYLDDANDWVSVQMSSNGTAGPWTEIVRFAGPANETAYRAFSRDVSAHISNNTVLRFLGSPNLGSSDYVFFDNVDITCAP